MADTSIAWTDKVWNPVTGCSRVSAGCKHCYAANIAKRFWGSRPFNQVECHEDRLRDPLLWKKSKMVFVNSMSDLFHPDVPFMFITAVLAHALNAQQHRYQILTKRPARMLEYMKWNRSAPVRIELTRKCFWWGVSVEDQKTADERVPLLQEAPVGFRFISAEPLLDGIEFGSESPELGWTSYLKGIDGCDPAVPGIDWVIVGGESGPGARPCRVEWIRSIVEQCAFYKTPCFVKQLGAHPVFSHEQSWQDRPVINGIRSATWDATAQGWDWPTKDRKGGDPAEWPEDLRVQQFPEVAL